MKLRDMSVICENATYNSLASWAEHGIFKVGIVIGHCTKEKDVIVHLAEAPIPEICKSNINNFPLQSLEETHFAEHAAQIIRMLPGGLDVMGIFLVIPQSDVSSNINVSHLKSMMRKMYKAIPVDSNPSKVLLVGCPQSKQITIKRLDVSDINAPLISGTLNHSDIKWTEINYSYTLDSVKYMGSKDHNRLFLKDHSFLLDKLEKELNEHLIILFDGESIENDELLTSIAKENLQAERENINRYLRADCLQMEPNCTEKAFTDSKGELLCLGGSLIGRAYVTESATAKVGIEAVHTDLVRSLLYRWQMHCDSIVEEPPELVSSSPVFHEPPRRVFFKAKGVSVTLCDYLFPGDTIDDACTTAKELLGLPIRVEDIEETKEVFVDSSCLSFEQSSGVEHNVETAPGCNSLWIRPTVYALLFVIIAVSVAQLIY